MESEADPVAALINSWLFPNTYSHVIEFSNGLIHFYCFEMPMRYGIEREFTLSWLTALVKWIVTCPC